VPAYKFIKIIRNISECLYALINYFDTHIESEYPKAIKDHITMLDFLFNKSLKNTISQSNWNFTCNMLFAFLGRCYEYEPAGAFLNSSLKSCILDFYKKVEEYTNSKKDY